MRWMWVALCACSRPPAVGHDARADAPPDMIDAVTIDAPPGIATGDPHTAVPCIVLDATNVYWGSGFQPSYVVTAPIANGAQGMQLAIDPVENACPVAISSTGSTAPARTRACRWLAARRR